MQSFKTTAPRKRAGAKTAKRAGKENGNGHSHAANDDGFTAGPVNPNIRNTGETTTSSRRRKAVAQDLPGMEDRRIDVLHEKAQEYAGYRDERMSWGAKEVKAKGELHDLMKAHKRDHYLCEGVEVVIEHGKEKVKVKIANGEDDESDEAITGE